VTDLATYYDESYPPSIWQTPTTPPQTSTVVSVAPPTADIADAPLALVITGTGFVDGAVVVMTSTDVATTYVNDTTLSLAAWVPEFGASTYGVSVRNPDGTISSSGVDYVVTDAAAEPTAQQPESTADEGDGY
jgi:hypothetical protein